ncbi:MAG: hypothetical protein KAW17_10485 [Candidatus Eisenbacteria sp.]|nr:hypothetical protein [Candidatus Eisenbacteria bacterium]
MPLRHPGAHRHWLRIVVISVLVLGSTAAVSGESVFSSLGLGESLSPTTSRGVAMGRAGFTLVDTTSGSFLNPAINSLLRRVTLSVVIAPEVRFPDGVEGASRNWETSLSALKVIFPFPRHIALSVGLLVWRDVSSEASWAGRNSSADYVGEYTREGGVFSLPVHVSAMLTEHVLIAGGMDLVQVSSRETWTKNFPASEYQDSRDNLESGFSGAQPSGAVLIMWPGRATLGFVAGGGRDLDGTLTTRPVFGKEFESKATLRFPTRYGAGFSFHPHPGWTLLMEGRQTRWKNFRIAGESPLPDRTSNRISVGVERVSTRKAGTWMSRIPLRLGYWREPQPLEWPAGEQVVAEMLTFGIGFPLSGESASIDLALEIGRLGTMSTNGAEERIVRLSVGFTASERWHRKRQTKY